MPVKAKAKTTAKKQNPRIKLTPAKVKQIRAMYAKGKSQRAIAEKFGVSRSCIFGVTSGQTWSEVA